jgi:hypothetical protein
MSRVWGRPHGAPAGGWGTLSHAPTPADPDDQRCDPLDQTGHGVDPLGKITIERSTSTVAPVVCRSATTGAERAGAWMYERAWRRSRKGRGIFETSRRLWTDFLDGVAVPLRGPSPASPNRPVVRHRQRGKERRASAYHVVHCRSKAKPCNARNDTESVFQQLITASVWDQAGGHDESADGENRL